jgi:hypothetical protein
MMRGMRWCLNFASEKSLGRTYLVRYFIFYDPFFFILRCITVGFYGQRYGWHGENDELLRSNFDVAQKVCYSSDCLRPRLQSLIKLTPSRIIRGSPIFEHAVSLKLNLSRAIFAREWHSTIW